MENIRREVLVAYESEYRRLAEVYEEKTQRMRVLNETLRDGANQRSPGSVMNIDQHRSALRRFETLAGEITDLENRIDAARAQGPPRHADGAEKPTQLTEQLLQLSDMRRRLEDAAREFGEIMGQELQAEHDQQEMTGGPAQTAKLELSILEASTTCTAMLLQQLSEKINRWRFMSRQMPSRVGIADRGDRGGENDAQSVRSGLTRGSRVSPDPAKGRSGGPFDEPGMLVADSSIFLAAMEGNGDIAFDEPGVVIFSWAGRNNSPAAAAAAAVPGEHCAQCQGPSGGGHGFPQGGLGGSGPPGSIF
ncbi:hypothetical protein MCOR25_003535 [Pyricularia grisea]|uniref:Uncharacterized protein n=1 Tax=Pyricularia grisea TaxID=148305 RepID=A0A6P8AXQ9_PYRGI|nr:hypothetical protein PgNI_10335 [Pyricularia grisea]KAI6373137.1 hypothetical protein MCOR25_003535 [Pyricularia grisea]TLD07127.1 hypothetical protein PgNI_10335 [Pyricularia grisea]